MSIPYRKREIIYESLMKYDVNFSELIDSLINESLGAFEKQYELTKEIASFAYSLLMNNKEKGDFEVNNEIVQKIEVELDLKVIWGCSASLIGVGDGFLSIKICMPDSYRMLSREKFMNAVSDPISHELMHYNVIIKRYKNDVIPDERPSYYDKLINIIRNENYNNSIVYEFAYGLYSTYYQEIAAMVSQTLVQFKNFLMGKEKNHINANSALKQCNSFIVYNNIINHLVPTINSMSEEEIYNEICIIFNENNIECNPKWVRKQTKKMYGAAKYAIHNIIRNTSSEFYN